MFLVVGERTTQDQQEKRKGTMINTKKQKERQTKKKEERQKKKTPKSPLNPRNLLFFEGGGGVGWMVSGVWGLLGFLLSFFVILLLGFWVSSSCISSLLFLLFCFLLVPVSWLWGVFFFCLSGLSFCLSFLFVLS